MRMGEGRARRSLYHDAAAPAARARRTALLSIGRRRAQVMARSGRFRRPSKGYENLLLADALVKTQRRCLDATEPENLDQIGRCLLVCLDNEMFQLRASLSRTARWVSPARPTNGGSAGDAALPRDRKRRDE